MRFQRLKLTLVISAAVVAAGRLLLPQESGRTPLPRRGRSQLLQRRGHLDRVSDHGRRAAPQVTVTNQPHTIFNRQKDQVWDLTLAQALEMALANNKIIRSAGAFTTPGNALMSNPNSVTSVYDPAIQESGVLFGARRRGGLVRLRRSIGRHEHGWIQPEHRELTRAKRRGRRRKRAAAEHRRLQRHPHKDLCQRRSDPVPEHLELPQRQRAGPVVSFIVQRLCKGVIHAALVGRVGRGIHTNRRCCQQRVFGGHRRQPGRGHRANQ